MALSTTHTYVTLPVRRAAYDEIRRKLEAAGYRHAFNDDGEIDMHGLALVVDTESSPPAEGQTGKENGSASAPVGGETPPPDPRSDALAAGRNSEGSTDA